MVCAFSSLQAFFHMNGYAFHVWTSYAITLGSILVLLFFIWFQNKKVEIAVIKQAQRATHKNKTED